MDDLIEEFVRKKHGKITYRSWLNTFFISIKYLEKIEGKKGEFKFLKDPDNYFNSILN